MTLVLLAGFGYAIYSLGPTALRVRLVAGVAYLLHRSPVGALRRIAQRLRTTTVKATGACGGCQSCGSEEPSPVSRAAATEVRIPLSHIGRRE